MGGGRGWVPMVVCSVDRLQVGCQGALRAWGPAADGILTGGGPCTTHAHHLSECLSRGVCFRPSLPTEQLTPADPSSPAPQPSPSQRNADSHICSCKPPGSHHLPENRAQVCLWESKTALGPEPHTGPEGKPGVQFKVACSPSSVIRRVAGLKEKAPGSSQIILPSPSPLCSLHNRPLSRRWC